MGNLFIGFPVPRAKIATMIEEAAPPLEHYENHLPDGTDPIVLPGDITTDQILQWNGTKFTGLDEPAAGLALSPISIHPSQFIAGDDQQDYVLTMEALTTRTSFDPEYYYAPVILPDDVRVTKVTLFSYRDDASAYSNLKLYRVSNVGQEETMATCVVDWTNGNGSKENTSISLDLIHNDAYSYCLRFYMHCNDSLNDLKLYRVQVDFE